MKKLIFFGALLASQLVFAGEIQKLLTVTSDAKPGKTFYVSVELMDNSMEIKALLTGGTGEKDRTYTAAEIKKQTPVLVWDDSEKQNREVVNLDARKVSTLNGGKVSIIYLKNGIVNSKGNFAFELDREGDRWVLIAEVDGVRKTFNTMFMKKNTVLGQTVGIDEVIVK